VQYAALCWYLMRTRFSLPLLTNLYDILYTHCLVLYVRDVPYDYTTLLENVLDASHLPYTHHKV
jgi:phenylpropionate dioxygenase-like ring-hydroxylating dioxygenase large terminal subunit